MSVFSIRSLFFTQAALIALAALIAALTALGQTPKTPHPLTRLMLEKNSQLRPELRGVHPRVFVTEQEIKPLQQRARTTHRTTWRQTLAELRALKSSPPPAPAQQRRAQNEVGVAIAEAALAYRVEGKPEYLEAAKKYMDAAASYEVWGHVDNKPDIDLAAGHLLYGLGWGYDLLYHDLSEAERRLYRDKLAKQARLLFNHYLPRGKRLYPYSQNHLFIPIAGLAIAAYALYDEVDEAPQWAALARAVFDRVLATFSTDGYYYEGFEYWIFSTPWLVHYLDAHAHATGEDLYDHPGIKGMHLYIAHSMLPDGKYVFDFGDIYEGPTTRAGEGDEYRRANPAGRFHSNYNVLYRLASRFKSGDAQGVAEWMKSFRHYNAEEYWSLLWYDPAVKATPMREQPRWHYFRDHEVVYWRSAWSPDATAFAFKCGPPEGHHTAERLREFPDWRLSTGHAHPDAASFILYARETYLTGDAGYAGVPMTSHHNTALVDGRGQAQEGRGHDAFKGVPYDRLNEIRILEASLAADRVVIRADASRAYEPALGLTSFVRTFEYDSRTGFLIRDDLQAGRPATFTSMLHADDSIETLSASAFRFVRSKASLKVEAGSPVELKAVIEPTVLTAPGQPGAVAKGEQQVRGRQLAVSNAVPSERFQLVYRLQVEPGRRTVGPR